MKTATIVVTSFSVLCPWCREVYHAPNGSEFFTPEDVEPGEIVQCKHEPCQREFRMPTTIKGSDKKRGGK
jgi:hypothetical protein